MGFSVLKVGPPSIKEQAENRKHNVQDCTCRSDFAERSGYVTPFVGRISMERVGINIRALVLGI